MSMEQIGSVSQPAVSQIENVIAKQVGTARQDSGEVVAGAVHQAPGEATVEEVQKKSSADSMKELDSAVKTTNKFLQALAQNLQFSIDKDTEKVVVKLVDVSTKEVVKQIPPEEMLAIAKALDKLQGLLIREKA